MPAVRTNGAVFGCATKISAQVMPRMMMAVLKFSVNFQVRRNVSAPKAKRTKGALKPFNFLPNCTISTERNRMIASLAGSAD